MTWLVLKDTGLGCTLCNVHGFQSTLARCIGGLSCLKVSTLARHNQCHQHRQALALLLDQASSTVWRAPTADQFQKVWDDLRAGSSAATWDGGKRKQTRTERCKEWALAEAIRQLHRNFLAGAETISISGDSREGRLLVRFAAVNANLERREGSDGWVGGWGQKVVGVDGCASGRVGWLGG